MRSQFDFRPFPHCLVASIVVIVALAPVVAFAHPGHGHAPEKVHGVIDGLNHPLSGLDHCCAMIAVGVWAAQREGRTAWAVPVAFLSLMIVGGILGMFLSPIARMDQGIAASVLVLGLLISFATRLPLAVSLGIAGLFAVFHGYVHIVEMPRSTLIGPYGLGILVTSSLLLALGILVTQLLIRSGQRSVVRWSGVAISACSLLLCFR